MKRKFDLEDRTVAFASEIIKAADILPGTFGASHLGRQLIRSGTSVALNYGEAQAAESSADFIHKLKLALKELKESNVCLRILVSQNYIPETRLVPIIQEANELVAILMTSIKTARHNQSSKSK